MSFCVYIQLLTLKKGIVIVLEGGYTPDVVAECSASCLKVLCGDSVEETMEYFPRKDTWLTIRNVSLPCDFNIHFDWFAEPLYLLTG